MWIDGHHVAVASLSMMSPKDVMALEFYPRASTVPMDYRPIERKAGCGALLVWSNWAFSR